jgi:HEAT repeat protein
VNLTYLAIGLITIAAASPAPDARPATSERTAIETYLATHDLPTVAGLDALSKLPEKTLMAIALDAHGERLTRARAVAALRLLPSPAVQDFLAKLIRDNASTTDATERLLLRRAAISLGWMSGSDAPERLALLFENEDAEVRLDAVSGIAMSRAETAVPVLRKQLSVEASPRVRDQIRRQLKVLSQPVPQPEKAPSSKKPQRAPMRGGF